MYSASAGVGLYVLFNSSESLKMYSKELTKMTLHFMARPQPGEYGYQPLSNGQHNQQYPNGQHPNGSNEHMILPLNERMDNLARELKMMRESQFINFIGGGQPPSTSTIILVVGVTGVILYLSGVRGFDDVMYVTKKNFSTTIEALKEGVAAVSSALARAKEELLEKIGIVESKIDAARESLELKIGGVHDEILGVSKSQNKMEDLVRGIEGKIELTQDQIKQANRGIYILCSVLAESGVSNDDLLEFTQKHGGSGIQRKPSTIKSFVDSLPIANSVSDKVTSPQVATEAPLSMNEILLREGLQNLLNLSAKAGNKATSSKGSFISNDSNLPFALPLDGNFSSILAGARSTSSR